MGQGRSYFVPRWLGIWVPFQYKYPLVRCRSSYHRNETVVRPSYLYNENPFTGETSLYWDHLVLAITSLLPLGMFIFGNVRTNCQWCRAHFHVVTSSFIKLESLCLPHHCNITLRTSMFGIVERDSFFGGELYAYLFSQLLSVNKRNLFMYTFFAHWILH